MGKHELTFVPEYLKQFTVMFQNSVHCVEPINDTMKLRSGAWRTVRRARVDKLCDDGNCRLHHNVEHEYITPERSECTCCFVTRKSMHDSSKSLDFLEHHIENWLDCVKHFVQEPRDYVTDIATPQFARYGLPVRLSGGAGSGFAGHELLERSDFRVRNRDNGVFIEHEREVQLFIRAMCSANERHM